MVVKGSYKTVEKVFLAASFVYLAYIVAGVLAHPDWKSRWHGHRRAAATCVSSAAARYLYMVIGVIGTTIAPWMQFYLQSSVVEKGITEKQYGASRLDVIVGCIFTDVVAWFIVVACAATLFVAGHHDLKDGAEAAASASPAGRQVRLYSVQPWDCSTPRSLPPASCPSPRPMPSARAWVLRADWTRSSARRRSSTGSTPD